MRSCKFKICLLFISFLLRSEMSAIKAQSLSGFAGAFADVPISARTAGMGQLQCALASPSEALFCNPAALMDDRRSYFSFSYFRLFGLLPNFATSYSRQYNNNTALGFAIQTNGDDLYRESTLNIGVSNRFFLWRYTLDTGVSFAFRYGSFGHASTTPGAITGSVWGHGLVFGAKLWMTKYAVLALMVQNIANTLHWSTSGMGTYTEGLPYSLILGAALLNISNMNIGMDWVKSLYHETYDILRLGIEKHLFSYFMLRTGYVWSIVGENNNRICLGLGIHFPFHKNKEICLDFAYTIEELPNTLRITIGYVF